MLKKPWRIVYTDFGESMGTDSKSKIVDADGKPVATIGNGDARSIADHEAAAAEIVSAVNGRNASLIPKPVDPRREKVKAVLESRWPGPGEKSKHVSDGYLADRILAALDAKE
jgi:hypothetical protein